MDQGMGEAFRVKSPGSDLGVTVIWYLCDQAACLMVMVCLLTHPGLTVPHLCSDNSHAGTWTDPEKAAW